MRDIPVVIMSANESNDIIALCLSIIFINIICLEMGAKNYLVKPIRLSECKALVAEMKKPTVTPG